MLVRSDNYRERETKDKGRGPEQETLQLQDQNHGALDCRAYLKLLASVYQVVKFSEPCKNRKQ